MTALAISNIVLWVVVTCLVFVLLALTRQLGVLHERIAPAGALMKGNGLIVIPTCTEVPDSESVLSTIANSRSCRVIQLATTRSMLRW